MELRKLWNTDLQVSKICLGTMTWWYQNTQEDAFQQLDFAIANWINFIDTAEMYAVPPTSGTYWKTETYIWNWIKERKNRKSFILASKVAWPWSVYIREGQWLTQTSIKDAIEWSLSRLQTDYLDLYQLHRPQRPVPLRGKANYHESMHTDTNQYLEQIEEILQSLQKIQQEWKVKYFWLSNETPWGTMKFLELAKQKGYPRIQSIQNAYNILRRDFESWLAEISLNENIWLLAYSPLARGFLSWKYFIEWENRWNIDSWWKDRYGYYTNSRAKKMISELQDIANWLNISLTHLCLAFVNDHKFVTSTIIWATNMDQLQENISSANIKLTQDTYDKIDQIFTHNPNPGLF